MVLVHYTLISIQFVRHSESRSLMTADRLIILYLPFNGSLVSQDCEILTVTVHVLSLLSSVLFFHYFVIFFLIIAIAVII